MGRILIDVEAVVDDKGCCSTMEFGGGRSSGVWRPMEERDNLCVLNGKVRICSMS